MATFKELFRRGDEIPLKTGGFFAAALVGFAMKKE
jgi:hypothetical protein